MLVADHTIGPCVEERLDNRERGLFAPARDKDGRPPVRVTNIAIGTSMNERQGSAIVPLGPAGVPE